MKRNITFALLFILGLSIGACSGKGNLSSAISSSDMSNSSSASSSSYSVPKKEAGVSLETFSEEMNKLSPQSNNRKIRISYHIIETLEGSTQNATYRNGEPLPEGTIITDLVLESKDNSASSVKVVSGNYVTHFSTIFQTGINVTLSFWNSYRNERKTAVTNEAQPGWNTYSESVNINPFNVWWVESGNRPANAGVEGTFLAYTELERTFDNEGYCQTLRYKEFTYIDGIYSKYDINPQYFKGAYSAEASATIEYLD